MDAELRALVNERGTVKAVLTRFKNFFNESASNTAIGSLRKRLEANTKLFAAFDRVQTKIETLVAGTEIESLHESERQLFETSYFDLIDEVETYIEKSGANQRRDTPVSSISNNAPCSIKLPTIQLPVFDGDYSDWVKFRDTFTSVIHQNETLSDVQRFLYLNSSLQGVAARVIQSLGVSEANYKVAWEFLTARYENSKDLKRHHVNALMDLKPVQKQSEIALRQFIDDAYNHRNALRSLEEAVDSWDTFLVPLLSRKLDAISIREWEKKISSDPQMPSFVQFSEFVEERSKYLGNVAIHAQVTAPRVDQRPRASGSQKSSTLVSHVINTNVCGVCKGSHPIYQCDRFKGFDADERTKAVQQAQVCFNCLQSGHRVKACTRTHCRICGKIHHSLLHRADRHPDKPAKSNDISTAESSNISSIQSSDSSTMESKSNEIPNVVAHVASSASNHTMLSTAIVHVKGDRGHVHDCRVLLDSGSQANFVTNAFCKRVGFPPIPIESIVTGLGRVVNSITGRTKMTIHSRHNNYQASLDCLSIDTITADMPSLPLSRELIEVPNNVALADPEFNTTRPIDMLIGAGLFWALLCIGQHKCRSGIIYQKTQLGWVLGGAFTWPNHNRSATSVCHLVTYNDLRLQVEKFWALEEVDVQRKNFNDECESYFRQTTYQDVDGRYIVSIPFKNNVRDLGDSRQQAVRRLYSIERKLTRQPDLRQQYVDFMKEYEMLGHMSRISECPDNKEPTYYLPHHAVSKATSTTTKVRVVFDGSAKSSSGLSLNDTQLVGPTIQSDLVSILIRFRQHKYVLSADIAKMYRQVLINPKDRRFQRILWRSDPRSPIKEFELNTVTYGTASAPFLATRVLQEIGLKCAQTFPEISRIIISDFYVDDLLTGAQSALEIQKLKTEITRVLSQAGMHLRKWASNCPNIHMASDGVGNSKEITADKDPKTLGLLWAPTTDELGFTIMPTTSRRVTKRSILSDIAQIFDPLGLIGPVVVTAKLILQRLWQVQVGWDESIPQELFSQWLEYRQDLERVSSFRIPRCAVSVELDTTIPLEIHGFSDSSERAYGACVYLRSRNKTGQWVITLLCAKSRVAPLKSISLPRLELCGALLLAQLVEKVKVALNSVNVREHLWTDSTIALAWIRSSPHKWKTFVANRVSEIQTLTESGLWRHVSSGDNPADLISRGVKPTALAQAKIWWSGPSWLSKESNLWPNFLDECTNPPEERTVKSVMVSLVNQHNSIFTRFSSYTRLLRVTAYCLRFIKNARLKLDEKRVISTVPNMDLLTTDELRQARTFLERLVQREAFEKEIIALQSRQSLPKSTSLLSLNAFLDDKGLLRVGGRLQNAPISQDRKQPIILPSKHPFTDLIIIHEHHRLLHAGCQAVIASLRNRYWPLACKNNVKRIIRGCIRCFRVNPTNEVYQMGQLPTSRVTPARPFFTCGVDYAGPFYTKERVRSRVSVKAYLCIFVCFVTRAVHIELATDLSTDAFLNCFRRFIARRGRCQYIVSDNGTNFVGARNELDELRVLLRNKEHNRKITNALNQEFIEWRLIPPHSPHFGGLWEGAVKSAKHHLKRVIGDQKLTFEELYTLLTQVESCLNSRPLSPLSSDPTDLSPLTPGHFLIGTALNALPAQDLRDVQTNRLNRYQLIQQMLQHFWQRWQNECIHQMQQRYKWQRKSTSKLAVDRLVLIKEDNLPPLQWSLARIQLHPGTDGIARVATVRTSTGTTKRPVTKLCILPMDCDADHTEDTTLSGHCQ
ncbi:uncharacterized protein LOC114882244 [Osmia bicornis bicornis]|uniref:uncharacterized protein LOC114882244 n=1 Tax=Osmia bicornis bicornis TaxID=1437191 RepID=UPI001EAF8063|nr:uncharacterized protein LOC114882244 [Osmia bicornis bicornis]